MRELNRVVPVAVFLLCLQGCSVIPPPHISKPSVLVEYQIPVSSPDPSQALLVKIVTQRRTRPYLHSEFPFYTSDWRIRDEPLWSRAFLCSIDVETGEKKMVMEIPIDWMGGVCSSRIGCFSISTPLGKAILISYTRHIVVIDLATKRAGLYRLDSVPFTVPELSVLALSPDGEEFALGICPSLPPSSGKPQTYGLAICRFDGGVRLLPTEKRVLSVCWPKDKQVMSIGALGWTWIIDPKSLEVLEKIDWRTERWQGIQNKWSVPTICNCGGRVSDDASFSVSAKVAVKASVVHDRVRIQPIEAASMW